MVGISMHLLSPVVRLRTALIAVAAVSLAVAPAPFSVVLLAQAQALRIVVLEGEDAVNIIQQKTAVAPVVEVRDRNDQPVAGAVVSFTIRGGRATFNGARALTLTTNATGRAVASGLTPTGTGALRISASAVYQGQTAAVTIAQTNVATAAQAAALSTSAAGASSAGTGTTAAAGAGTGAGTAATGAAAAGGAVVAGAGVATTGGAVAAGAGAGGAAGGISATTIGIIGGAVAGGTIVATKVAGGLGGGEESTYRGDFSISTTFTATFTLPNGSIGRCTSALSLAGTASMTVETLGNGTVNAHLDMNWTEREGATNCPVPQPSTPALYVGLDFEGSGSNLQMARTDSGTGGNGFTITRFYGFTGSVGGGTVSGTVSLSRSAISATNSESFPLSSTAVTLQKQ